jgi:hypothetical protein
MDMSMSPDDLTSPSRLRRVVEAVRLDLEAAGNPTYVLVVVHACGTAHSAPIIFSAVGPASQHARRLRPTVGEDERLLIVSRHASRSRQTYNVLDPATLRKLHVQDEVIEASVVQTHGPV